MYTPSKDHFLGVEIILGTWNYFCRLYSSSTVFSYSLDGAIQALILALELDCISLGCLGVSMLQEGTFLMLA